MILRIVWVISLRFRLFLFIGWMCRSIKYIVIRINFGWW